MRISRAIPLDEQPSADLGAEAGRRWTRTSYWLRVTLYGPKSFVAGTVENLSEGGLFVAARHSFELGTNVEFELELPAGRLTLNAVVRWLRPYDPARGVYPGIGLSFGDMDQRQRDIVRTAMVIGSQRPEDDRDTPT